MPLPERAAGRLAGLLAGWLARRPAGWKAATTLRVVGCEGLGQVGTVPATLGNQGLKESRGKKPTAPDIPRWSPTQLLTRPDPA